VISTGITFACDDEALAIHKYLTCYAPRTREAVVDLPVPMPARNKPPEQMPLLTTFDRVTGQATQHMSEAAIWSWVRQQILNRPLHVAQMTGIEQISYLADLAKPTASPTLDEVGSLYLDHAKISQNWHAKCKLFWQEFCDAVEIRKLRELTQDHVVEYADMIQEAAETPTYCRQRFGAIKSIINYPTKRGKWAEDAKRALALCSVLVPPKKSAVDPKPISREVFHALCEAADDQMKAMLLLALNCCMYGGELAALDWTDLNLDKGTLTTERNKTGIVRIAVLWGRTIEALRKLPRHTNAIFVTSSTKMRHNYQTLYKVFKALRKSAQVSEAQFAQLRDGAYTAAVESGVELNVCRLLAGHATGISDHYVKRRPQMVAAACAAVERAYFGNT